MMAPLRLLAFCDYFGSGSSGGSERASQEIYERLASDGHDVTVVSALPSAAKVVPVTGVDVVERRGWALSGLTGAQVMFAPSVFRDLDVIVEKKQPQLLHANNLYFQSTLAASVLGRRRRIPLITTAHTGGLDAWPPMKRMLATAYLSTAGRYALRRSVHLIAVAPSVKGHLVRLGVPGSRVSVVRNGVDHERFHPAEGEKATDALRIGFVGRLIENKRPLVLVRALAQLAHRSTPFTATFVGDGPQRAELNRMVRDLGLVHCVSVVGETDDVPERLRNVDVLVQPSQAEGLSLVILEAMACGVCVVASDIPGNRDAVSHGITGVLFPRGDASALAKALIALAKDPARRRRLAEAGRKLVANLTWENTARETLAVFERVLAG